MESIKLSIFTPRQPVVLIIDTSESMRKDGKIDLVNEFLHKFKEKILQDWEAKLSSKDRKVTIEQRGIEISIVAFGKNDKSMAKFVPISEFNPKTYVAQGVFQINSCILQAFNLIDKRKKKYQDNLIYCERPLVILLAGSEPTDMNPDDSEWKEEVIKKIQNSNSSFYIMAIEPINKITQNLLSISGRKQCIINKDSLNNILDKVVRKELVRVDTVIEPSSEKGPLILDSPKGWEDFNFNEMIKQDQDGQLNKFASQKSYPYIFGTSVIGPLHIQKEIVCQDACAYESLAYGYGVIAVADGLGSASKSDIGAETTVEAALHEAKTIIENRNFPEKDLDYIAREAVASARKELELKAVEERCDLRDLACTLIVVIICKDSISAAQIGDGAVVARKDGKLVLFSDPGDSEYVNEVVPLTSKEWKKSLRIAQKVSNVECVAVFTDGCQRVALCKTQNDLKPYDRFFEPLFSYAQKLNNLKQGEQDIRDLLVSKKISENSEDDKTFVISILKNEGGGTDKSYRI